jgi:hypothetical protein
MGTVTTFGGVVARRLGASPELLTLLSCSLFLGFLCSMVASRLANRVRWGRLLGILLLLQAGITSLVAVAHGATVFVAILAASLVVHGASKSLPSALMKVHVHSKARASVLKWTRIVGVLAALPIALIAGPILDARGSSYRIVFPLAAAAGAIGAIEFFRLPQRTGETHLLKARAPRLDEELRILARDRGFLLFILVFFVGPLAEKISMPLVPIYFTDVLHLNYKSVGLAVGVAGPAAAILGFWLAGRMVSFLGPLNLTVVAMFVKSVRPVLWALAPLHPDPMPFLVVGEAVFRFSVSGLELGAILSVINYANYKESPAYLGIHYLFMGIRGLLGPLIGLALYKQGFDIRNIYWLVAAIVWLGAFALLALAASPGGRKSR